MKVFNKVGDVLNPSTYLNPEHIDVTTHIVHACNSLGIMGGGLALQVRNQYPQAFEVYKAACDTKVETTRHELLGTLTHYRYPAKYLTIINAITQLDIGTYKRQTSYDAVVEVFERIAGVVKSNPDSFFVFAIPVNFGCALGGANWSIVRHMVETLLSPFENVNLYWVMYNGV